MWRWWNNCSIIWTLRVWTTSCRRQTDASDSRAIHLCCDCYTACLVAVSCLAKQMAILLVFSVAKNSQSSLRELLAICWHLRCQRMILPWWRPRASLLIWQATRLLRQNITSIAASGLAKHMTTWWVQKRQVTRGKRSTSGKTTVPFWMRSRTGRLGHVWTTSTQVLRIACHAFSTFSCRSSSLVGSLTHSMGWALRVFGQRIAGIIKKVIKQMSRNAKTRVESKLRKPKTVEIAYSDDSQDKDKRRGWSACGRGSKKVWKCRKSKNGHEIIK